MSQTCQLLGRQETTELLLPLSTWVGWFTVFTSSWTPQAGRPALKESDVAVSSKRLSYIWEQKSEAWMVRIFAGLILAQSFEAAFPSHDPGLSTSGPLVLLGLQSQCQEASPFNIIRCTEHGHPIISTAYGAYKGLEFWCVAVCALLIFLPALTLGGSAHLSPCSVLCGTRWLYIVLLPNTTTNFVFIPSKEMESEDKKKQRRTFQYDDGRSLLFLVYFYYWALDMIYMSRETYLKPQSSNNDLLSHSR